MKTELTIPALLHNTNKEYTLKFTDYEGTTFTSDCMFCLYSIYSDEFPRFLPDWYKSDNSGFKLHIEDLTLPLNSESKYHITILPLDSSKPFYVLEQVSKSRNFFGKYRDRYVLSAISITRSDFESYYKQESNDIT